MIVRGLRGVEFESPVAPAGSTVRSRLTKHQYPETIAAPGSPHRMANERAVREQIAEQ